MQDDDIRLQLLDPEQDIRHRRCLSNDEQSPLLEEEACEPTLKWATVGDHRGASRRPFAIVGSRILGIDYPI